MRHIYMRHILAVLFTAAISGCKVTTPPPAATYTCTLIDANGRTIRPSRLLIAWLLADGTTWHEWTADLVSAKQTHVLVSMASGDYTLERQPTMYPAYLTALLREGLVPVIPQSDVDKLTTSRLDIVVPAGVLVSPTWALLEGCQ